MDFTGNSNLFGLVQIPSEAEVIFVADLFVEDYVGGAELTSEALIGSSPFNVFKLKSRQVTMELLEKGKDKFWVFGNFAQMDLNLVPAIMANLKYCVLEYDYKFCRMRSIEKHVASAGKCDCEQDVHGKLISAFYRGARHLWFMSEKQQQIYLSKFPELQNANSTVLSSVFDNATLATLKLLREKYSETEKDNWIVLGSNSWVKGFDDAKQYCEDRQLKYEVVWNVPYVQLLDKLAQAKGFVYLPKGNDTCPRMVIEAKLLGCELVLNEFVQHKDEEWFNPVATAEEDEVTQIEQYLYAAKDWFWNGVKADMEYKPTISGYTTTKDCISQNYPYEASIASMLEFCDEVVVMDGGSTDGTYERLLELAATDEKLKVYQERKDWAHPRFALFDGQLKDLARQKCTMEFCWQQDSDEIVHEDDGPKIKNIVNHFPANLDLVALPVIEYWGGPEKVRADINPWKWRLSRNRKHIAHGVPAQLRRFDELGMYSAPGSDGCDYVHRETGVLIPFGNFYTNDVEIVRRNFQLDPEARRIYEQWFNMIVEKIPGVFHFSWWDIERKVKTYRGYWGKHWKSLYKDDVSDTAENNVMFDIPWSEVTDDMIAEKAKDLADKTGGWIFHRKWAGQQTHAMKCARSLPKFILEWAKRA